jgi:hypothetical protein
MIKNSLGLGAVWTYKISSRFPDSNESVSRNPKRPREFVELLFPVVPYIEKSLEELLFGGMTLVQQNVVPRPQQISQNYMSAEEAMEAARQLEDKMKQMGIREQQPTDKTVNQNLAPKSNLPTSSTILRGTKNVTAPTQNPTTTVTNVKLQLAQRVPVSKTENAGTSGADNSEAVATSKSEIVEAPKHETSAISEETSSTK